MGPSAPLPRSRTAHALRDLFGAPVAAGTVACWVKRAALGVIEQVLPVIRDRITAAPVVNFDETGIRTDGRLAWLHSASTPTDVQTIRMPKLRIKVSGSMRTLTGAEHFAAIRSYTATAVRHGIGMLDALIQAATGNPWIPTTA